MTDIYVKYIYIYAHINTNIHSYIQEGKTEGDRLLTQTGWYACEETKTSSKWKNKAETMCVSSRRKQKSTKKKADLFCF